MAIRKKSKLEGEFRGSAAPSWEALFEVAEGQQGCFTTQQALDAGISNQLLYRHVTSGNIQRLQRGIYRMTRFPSAARDQEDLIVVWLWSNRAGVFSHETALQLHDLSDTLPANIHITVPQDWAERSVKVPKGVRLYIADFSPAVCSFVGSVPVTTPGRSIVDVARAHGDANVVETAIRQAISRNVAAVRDLHEAVTYVAIGAPPGHTRVRPDAVVGLGGSWINDGVSGTCRQPPPSDWRVAAEEMAREHGARLRSAEYFPDSRTQYIELVWPLSERETKPSWEELRQDAAARFGWV